jgi:hypothetical protein
MSGKSILEQALLQVQTLEEAVKANAKGILASTMKQELNDLLKESMEEEDEDVNEQPDSEEETTDDVPDETGDDETSLDNTDDMDDELSDDEPSKDIDDLDSEDDTMDSPEMDDMDDMTSMDDMGDMGGMDDEDVVDMTSADEDEILKVFKAMGPNDGVIVKKDNKNIELSDGDDEYIIKLDEMGDSDDDMEMSEEDETMEDSHYDMEMSEEDETVYEIELDDIDDEYVSDDFGDDMEMSEEDETIEGDVDEAARTKSNPHGDKGGMNRTGIKSKKVYKAGSGTINEEVTKLKKQNNEYKKALLLFKEKLNEVAVFNANLAYATRLFTEHSTTKQEKLNILKRFDSISTLKESKNLYSSITTELGTKKTVTESVVEKITTTPTSSSTKVLSESKAYENPQFKRMKDLMLKLK